MVSISGVLKVYGDDGVLLSHMHSIIRASIPYGRYGLSIFVGTFAQVAQSTAASENKAEYYVSCKVFAHNLYFVLLSTATILTASRFELLPSSCPSSHPYQRQLPDHGRRALQAPTHLSLRSAMLPF